MILYLCIKIFLARIIDVTLSTFVTILTVKGKKNTATIIGFIDVLIWFLVVKEALNTKINNFLIPLSYASGYAIGTYFGTYFSNKFINYRISVLTVIDIKYIKKLYIFKKNGYSVSILRCNGINNSKKLMLFIEVNNKKYNDLINTILKVDKNAFITVNESKQVINGFIK